MRARAFLAWTERWSWWFPAVFAVAYLITVGLLARSQSWTYDEIITEHVARLPAFADVLAVLREGEVDKVPPLFYAMTRTAVAALGAGPVAYRAPEILAGLLAALCVFRFVSRRTPAVYAASAMVFPFATHARRFAYEARPGMLAVAFVALALVAWQSAGEGRRRPLALVVLGASLAVAVGMHYYAAVAVLPLAIGEVVRSLDRRRVDVPVWIALGAPALPLLVFLPLIRGAMTPLGTFFARPSWAKAWDFYPWMLETEIQGRASLAILVVVVVGLGLAWFVEGGPIALPRHEVVAAWGLALLPTFGVTLALTVTRAYTVRHALPAVIGLAVVLAWTAARWWRGSIAMGLLLLAAVGAWAALGTHRGLSAARLHAGARARTVAMIRANAVDERPIVVGHPHVFLHLSHDTPPGLARRFVYLVDWKAALRHRGHDTPERILTGLARRVPLDVREYAEFVASAREYWLFAPRVQDAWVRALTQDPALRLSLRGQGERGRLFFVTPR